VSRVEFGCVSNHGNGYLPTICTQYMNVIISILFPFLSIVRARWIGFLSITSPGTFTLYLSRFNSLQKVLMWLDDVLIIDGWNDAVSFVPSGSFFISNSGLHDVQIIYSNEASVSPYGISFFWSCSRATNPFDFRLISTESMYTRDDLAVNNLTIVQKSFLSWQQSANHQPQVTGLALSIATAGVFVSFSITLPDTLAESSMEYDPYSASRRPGVLSVASGTTTVFFTEPQTLSASTVLYAYPGESTTVGTISAGIIGQYSAILVSNSGSTFIQTLFSTNADAKYGMNAKLNGQPCGSSLSVSDSDISRVTKQLQWQSPAVYELVPAQVFTSSCSTSASVFPDNSNGVVKNYPTGCNAFNGIFDVFVGNDKTVDVVPHKTYGYLSVISGSLSATFYSTSHHLNSQQTLFHKQTGTFIGTISNLLVQSPSVRQGTLLQPSPITLTLGEFITGESFSSGYKINNTVLISNPGIGAAGPSILLTVTSVTDSGAIRAVAVKSPTIRSGGAYLTCRVTSSGVYKLIITNNRNDFVAPFSVFVYPNLPCSTTSIMSFPNAHSRTAAVDFTSFSVNLRDTFGNLVQGFSNPLGVYLFYCI
jgi:hypothetical protein